MQSHANKPRLPPNPLSLSGCVQPRIIIGRWLIGLYKAGLDTYVFFLAFVLGFMLNAYIELKVTDNTKFTKFSLKTS